MNKYLEAAEHILNTSIGFDEEAPSQYIIDAELLATLVRELHTLVTPEIVASAEFHESYIEFDGDGQKLIDRAAESKRRLSDFALAVLAKLEEST